MDNIIFNSPLSIDECVKKIQENTDALNFNDPIHLVMSYKPYISSINVPSFSITTRERGHWTRSFGPSGSFLTSSFQGTLQANPQGGTVVTGVVRSKVAIKNLFQNLLFFGILIWIWGFGVYGISNNVTVFPTQQFSNSYLDLVVGGILCGIILLLCYVIGSNVFSLKSKKEDVLGFVKNILNCK